MKSTTIRVSESLLRDLKFLKEIRKKGTYEDVLASLIQTELRKDHAITREGYLPIGAVVKDEGNLLVIKDIQGNKVIFDDNSCAINGGQTVYELVLVSLTVENCKEGRVHG